MTREVVTGDGGRSQSEKVDGQLVSGAWIGGGQVHVGSGYTEEELAFLRAVERYIKTYRRKFPSFVEVLRIAKAEGYVKRGEGAL